MRFPPSQECAGHHNAISLLTGIPFVVRNVISPVLLHVIFILSMEAIVLFLCSLQCVGMLAHPQVAAGT